MYAVASMGIDATFIPLESIKREGSLDGDGVCAILKALGEPQRFRIFTLLMTGERCVCDIEAGMKQPQNLISHHLRILRDAGLIEFRKEGRWSYYRINKETLSRFHQALNQWFDPDHVQDSSAQC
jgi:ArsR family transcriptional regulator